VESHRTNIGRFALSLSLISGLPLVAQNSSRRRERRYQVWLDEQPAAPGWLPAVVVHDRAMAPLGSRVIEKVSPPTEVAVTT
jgi:hypothetical protein